MAEVSSMPSGMEVLGERGSSRMSRVLMSGCCLGFEKRADFALEGGWVTGIRTDLDQHGVPCGIDDMEVCSHFRNTERGEFSVGNASGQ